MRVVLFSPGWPVTDMANGIVTYVATLARELREIGVEVRILTQQVGEHFAGDAYPLDAAWQRLGPVGKLVDRVAWRGFQRLALGVLPRVKLALAARALAREWPHDLCEMEETFGWAPAMGWASSVPLVVRLHGPVFLNGRANGIKEDARYRAQVRREGKAIGRALAVSAPSRDVLQRVREFYRLPLSNAQVIPNPGPRPDPEQTWSREEMEPNHVVFVGRFDRHKGGDLMIRAFELLLHKNPEARLSFAGPDKGLVDDQGRHWRLRDYVDARLGSRRDRVTVLGMLPPQEVSRLRRRAAVVVAPSRYETFCLALLEAVAQGAPVITSDNGGQTEVVTDGQTGLVFQTGNVADLAAKLELVLGRPELAAGLGAAALQDYHARFVPERVALQTRDFYASVLERTRA